MIFKQIFKMLLNQYAYFFVKLSVEFKNWRIIENPTKSAQESNKIETIRSICVGVVELMCLLNAASGENSSSAPNKMPGYDVTVIALY